MTDSFLADLKSQTNLFSDERDWNQFHSPKNLSMALIVEAAELVEHFQWMQADESDLLTNEKRLQVGDELADILIYTVRLANRLNIDLEKAAQEKMRKNKIKYPIEKSRGRSEKYTEL